MMSTLCLYWLACTACMAIYHLWAWSTYHRDVEIDGILFGPDQEYNAFFILLTLAGSVVFFPVAVVGLIGYWLGYDEYP